MKKQPPIFATTGPRKKEKLLKILLQTGPECPISRHYDGYVCYILAAVTKFGFAVYPPHHATSPIEAILQSIRRSNPMLPNLCKEHGSACPEADALLAGFFSFTGACMGL